MARLPVPPKARVVAATGLEPVWYFYPQILSLLCLPFHHAAMPPYYLVGELRASVFGSPRLSLTQSV